MPPSRFSESPPLGATASAVPDEAVLPAGLSDRAAARKPLSPCRFGTFQTGAKNL
jgi:hypothetical protein